MDADSMDLYERLEAIQSALSLAMRYVPSPEPLPTHLGAIATEPRLDPVVEALHEARRITDELRLGKLRVISLPNTLPGLADPLEPHLPG